MYIAVNSGNFLCFLIIFSVFDFIFQKVNFIIFIAIKQICGIIYLGEFETFLTEP